MACQKRTTRFEAVLYKYLKFFPSCDCGIVTRKLVEAWPPGICFFNHSVRLARSLSSSLRRLPSLSASG